MHTPYCVELRGTLPTVVLPAPGRQHLMGAVSGDGLLEPFSGYQRADVGRSQAVVVSLARPGSSTVTDPTAPFARLFFAFNDYDNMTPQGLAELNENVVIIGQSWGTVVRYILPLRLTGFGFTYAEESNLSLAWWTEDLAPLGYGRCTCARVE